MPSQENIVHTTPAEAPPPLQIGIFFDGTGNGDEIKNKNKWSNVKYLYDMHLGDDELLDNKKYTTRKFYQRGVGSHEDDSSFESSMGSGAKKRFENVIFHIEQYITEYRDKGFDGKYIPPTIQLDVFGFSRGAAMARHFVNCIKQNYFDFKDPDINKRLSDRNIKINFLGVFDTVGSFGIAGNNIDNGYSFFIDPSWIESKAVHIHALHEYRSGFDLQSMIKTQDTNYPFDIVEDKLIEIGLPGVHSDIGGGYNMAPPEKEQFSDNSLLAHMALKTMADYAIDNDVPLMSELSDSLRIQSGNALQDKSLGEVKEAFNDIRRVYQNSKWRPLLGRWCELQALIEIHKAEIARINRITSLASNHRTKAALQYNINKEHKTIEKIEALIKTVTDQMQSVGLNSSRFQYFKNSFEVLDEKYMHRSHFPFNTGIVKGYKIRDIDSIAMAIEEANENFWFWKRSESDNRPHRDLFYNQYKNFEQLNNKKEWHGNYQAKVPAEFFPLQSAFWEDENRD
jgi:hypothetical protein